VRPKAKVTIDSLSCIMQGISQQRPSVGRAHLGDLYWFYVDHSWYGTPTDDRYAPI